MPPKTAATPQPHMGRKIEKLRTLKGIKQADLAKRLGMAQSALSNLEQSESVDDDKLQKIADALEMSVEAIKNFNEEAVVNFVQHNYEGASGNIGAYNDSQNQTNHFNPLDEYVKMVEEYKKLVEENKRLYERLLESEKAK